MSIYVLLFFSFFFFEGDGGTRIRNPVSTELKDCINTHDVAAASWNRLLEIAGQISSDQTRLFFKGISKFVLAGDTSAEE